LDPRDKCLDAAVVLLLLLLTKSQTVGALVEALLEALRENRFLHPHTSYPTVTFQLNATDTGDARHEFLSKLESIHSQTTPLFPPALPSHHHQSVFCPMQTQIRGAPAAGRSSRTSQSTRTFSSGDGRSRQRHTTTTCSAAEPQAAKQERTAGRMTYRPESYAELVKDATNSVVAAIEDGITLMEVEFPAVPANIEGESSGIRWWAACGHPRQPPSTGCDVIYPQLYASQPTRAIQTCTLTPTSSLPCQQPGR
jgi:hypothetical protein